MKSRDRRDLDFIRIILSFSSRQILAQRMSGFVTNMFQYDVTVGITRSEVIHMFFESSETNMVWAV